MKKNILARIMYLLTGIVAGYQIIHGLDNYSDFTATLYTISFGLLLLASLLLLLMGFEIMENDYIAVIVSIIPISLALGIISDKLEHAAVYSALIFISFIIAASLRFFAKGKVASLAIGALHFISGTLVFLIPIFLFSTGKAGAQILFISLGGIIIGAGGMLLGFLKAGKSILEREKVVELFPIILFLTTTAFVIGLAE